MRPNDLTTTQIGPESSAAVSTEQEQQCPNTHVHWCTMDRVVHEMEKHERFAAPGAKVRDIWEQMERAKQEPTSQPLPDTASELRQVLDFLERNGHSDWSELLRQAFDNLIQTLVGWIEQRMCPFAQETDPAVLDAASRWVLCHCGRVLGDQDGRERPVCPECGIVDLTTDELDRNQLLEQVQTEECVLAGSNDGEETEEVAVDPPGQSWLQAMDSRLLVSCPLRADLLEKECASKLKMSREGVLAEKTRLTDEQVGADIQRKESALAEKNRLCHQKTNERDVAYAEAQVLQRLQQELLAERNAAELIAEEEEEAHRKQKTAEAKKKKKKKKKVSNGKVEAVAAVVVRPKSPGKLLGESSPEHKREDNPAGCDEHDEVSEASKEARQAPLEITAQLAAMQRSLCEAETAKADAEYELQHQKLWFSAIQKEAETSRDAEAQAYKQLDEYQQGAEEELRVQGKRVAVLEATLQEELRSNNSMMAELHTLRASCHSSELVQSESLLQSVDEMRSLSTGELDLRMRDHEEAVARFQRRLAGHLQALDKAREIKAMRSDYDHDQKLCVVCDVEPKTHIFTKCFHKCVCAGCADVIRARDKMQCPLCRQVSSEIAFVFE
eukprot:TRINITY_DN2760_c0_g1_i2.p1 TRINITY_DN2760_c0_g1~~TRINITY_DN2760_c0_g1_i2.p1  ORF type:complete len:613 (+),score=122.23 TRINITY_DN2760_c0_g1_i2:396-2234(+)